MVNYYVFAVYVCSYLIMGKRLLLWGKLVSVFGKMKLAFGYEEWD